MHYIVDTANLDKIRHCCEFFPVDGVTTNPTIISKEHTSFPELIKEIRSIIGMDRMLHVQVTGATCAAMIREAMALRDFLGGNLYLKIPICEEGLKATSELKKMGMKVTETAIFTQQQALVAARAGADYVAPYVNRLDNIVSDGVNVVLETVALFKAHNLDSQVLAASFKTAEQIHKISMGGTHAVTINPELFETLISHPMTIKAIDDFNRDWQSVYGDVKIADMFA